jgi:hypothetical protein
MKQVHIKLPLHVLLSGLLLAACGGSIEEGPPPSEQLLRTQESALCSGASVSSLTISSIHAYGGEAYGEGTWSVTFPANGVHLDFYIDGIKRGEQNVAGDSNRSGTWSFSYRPVTCGEAHTLEVRAYPLSIFGTGVEQCVNSNSASTSASFSEACPTSTLSCARTSTTQITCTGNGSGGTGGPYTGRWQRTEQNQTTGSVYQSGWYSGPLTNAFYCPQGTPILAPTNSDLLIEFKARDVNGLESNVLSQTHRCRF